jgi:Ca2+/H+ antiporter, TMEM165/GDT1 family
MLSLHALPLADVLSVSGVVFSLIFLAEIGDKSQLVCMTLASKYRPWPVLLGSVAAFTVLNVLAVVFGTVVAAWIPDYLLSLIVAALFGFFGVQSLLFVDDDEESQTHAIGSHGVFFTAFLLIFLAEFGDKTQLAVAGLASTYHGIPVWLGSTLALFTTSALGVVVGQRLLKRLPLSVIHKFSGVLFLLLAFIALYRAFP